MTDSPWETIDAALIRMRRLLELPAHLTDTVDLSAVLVTDTVARLRGDGEKTRIADIAANLTVKPSTASRLVASTEAAGFIRRTPSPDDPRSVALDLTPAGEELNATAKGFRIGFLRHAVSGWDDQTVTVFAALLDQFSRATATPPSSIVRESPSGMAG